MPSFSYSPVPGPSSDDKMEFGNGKEPLLDEYSNSEDEAVSARSGAAGRRHSRGLLILLSICLVISLLLNIIQSASFSQHGQKSAEPKLVRGRPSYTGLDYDKPTTYKFHNEFWNEKGETNDTLWENIITNEPVIIAPTPEWAAEKNLPESWPFPWDSSRSIYVVKVFHQIHCLKNLYRAFKSYERGEEPFVEPYHIGHCLDMLRQDLMCHADDTPMPHVRLSHSLGDGQVNQCMDWDKLVAWAKHPDRNACHQHFSEYRHIKNPIDRYAFCPPDSPYYETMKAYFDKHPWVGMEGIEEPGV